MSSLDLFPCTLLRDYPPEDLWVGYVVFGKCLPCGRVVLSEYCERVGGDLGAIFEENARVGVHFSVEESLEQELFYLPTFEKIYGKPGKFREVQGR